MKRACCGFTLIELLVVLVLASVLAAVALPLYGEQARKARRTQAQLALLELMARQEQHRMVHGQYAAFSATSNTPQWRWWVGDSAAHSSHELDGQACAGHTLASCIVLSARPGTARVNAAFADPDCGTLTLDSRGQQGADSASSRRCWP